MSSLSRYVTYTYTVPKDYDNYTECRQTLLIGSIIWPVATGLTKLSILFLYTEIFEIKWFRRVCMAMKAIVAMFIVAIMLSALLMCRPIQKTYNRKIPGQCGSVFGAEIATAVMIFVLDAILVVLPMPVLWKLQMPIRQKASSLRLKSIC